MSSALKKIEAEIISQSLVNDDVQKNLDSGVKNHLSKFGMAALLSTVAFFATDTKAMDNSLKGTLAASAIAGVIANGSTYDVPPGCDVSGISGWKVGGAAAVGGAVGNQMGGGNGKTLLTVLGGLFGASAATNSEINRMQEECAKQGIYPPGAHYNNALKAEDIMYSGTHITSGYQYMVTVGNSIGLAALVGKINPSIPLERANPIVNQALTETSQNLEAAYRHFEQTAQVYSQRIQGTTSSRYNVNQHNDYNANQNRQQLEYMRQNFNEAHENFVTQRAMFVHMADTAVEDGVQIDKFKNTLNYIDTPQMAKVLYGNQYSNKYVSLPNARRR